MYEPQSYRDVNWIRFGLNPQKPLNKLGIRLCKLLMEDKRGVVNELPEQGAAAGGDDWDSDGPEWAGDDDCECGEVRGAQEASRLPHQIHPANRVHQISQCLNCNNYH